MERCGDGFPLVLLPSMLVRAKTYHRLTDRLRKRFAVFVPEPPGSGAGAKLATPWSFQRYADWLIELLDALQLMRVTLVAHSNSGPPALLAAAAQPQRLSHLVVADVTGFAPASLWRLAAGRFLDGVLEAPFSMTALRDVVFNVATHNANFMHQVRLAAGADLSAVAPRVVVPTLVAWGRLDFTFPHGAATKLHRLLPKSSLCMFDAGSHDWLVQHAFEFAAAVDQFVRRT